jgi:hypothetical protein
MRLLNINHIEKKDVPLYYRNEYTAVSEFELIGNSVTNIPINFSVEMTPTGEKLIYIKIKQNIDYPIIPILRVLKEEIILLERKGQLL